MFRVLQLVADGRRGGRSSHVLQLMSSLRKEFDCTLLTQQGSYLAQQAKEKNLKLLCGDFDTNSNTLAAVSAMKRVAKKCRPDLIHAHGSRSAFLSSMADSQASVYTVYGSDYSSERTQSPRGFHWCREYWSMYRHRKMLFSCDFDRRLSKAERLLRNEKPFDVIYPGVCKPQRIVVRTKRSGIGFIGRLDVQKDPEQFVKVISRVPDASAVMVGAGPLGPNVRESIRVHGLGDRIKLYGALSHEKTLGVLAQLDVLVMTPKWESIPLLALEAMSLGVPVVSTAVGGIPEVITHGQTGLLAKSGTADDLAALTKNILSNEELRSSIVDRAEKVVANKFAHDTMIQRIAECYDKCLETQAACGGIRDDNEWRHASRLVRG